MTTFKVGDKVRYEGDNVPNSKKRWPATVVAVYDAGYNGVYLDTDVLLLRTRDRPNRKLRARISPTYIGLSGSF